MKSPAAKLVILQVADFLIDIDKVLTFNLGFHESNRHLASICKSANLIL